MIGRSLSVRAPFPQPPVTYVPAAMHGLGGGFVPSGALGQACPSCGHPVPSSAAPQRGLGLATAIAGSVASMTLAGLLTNWVSRRVLRW